MSTSNDITINQDIAVIRDAVDALRPVCPDPKHLDLILAHLADIDADAEALANQLAEAEAQTIRDLIRQANAAPIPDSEGGWDISGDIADWLRERLPEREDDDQ